VKDCSFETIAFIAQKGGVGKTTLAVNLAIAAGIRTILIDFDQQENAVIWADRPKSDSPTWSSSPSVACPKRSERQSRGFEWAIIDTPPAAGQQAFTVAQAADLVLIPCRPSPVDLAAIRPRPKWVFASENPLTPM
jgi:chromosome partitioning protein